MKDEAGKNAVWNQSFFLVLKNIHSKLTISVKDEDVTSSDLVGSAELSLRDLGYLAPST